MGRNELPQVNLASFEVDLDLRNLRSKCCVLRQAHLFRGCPANDGSTRDAGEHLGPTDRLARTLIHDFRIDRYQLLDWSTVKLGSSVQQFSANG